MRYTIRLFAKSVPISILLGHVAAFVEIALLSDPDHEVVRGVTWGSVCGVLFLVAFITRIEDFKRCKWVGTVGDGEIIVRGVTFPASNIKHADKIANRIDGVIFLLTLLISWVYYWLSSFLYR